METKNQEKKEDPKTNRPTREMQEYLEFLEEIRLR